MSEVKIRNTTEIQSEIFSNQERISKLTEKLIVLKEMIGEKQ